MILLSVLYSHYYIKNKIFSIKGIKGDNAQHIVELRGGGTAAIGLDRRGKAGHAHDRDGGVMGFTKFAGGKKPTKIHYLKTHVI